MEVKLPSSRVAIEVSWCCPGCLQFVFESTAFLYVHDCSESGLSLISKRLAQGNC